MQTPYQVVAITRQLLNRRILPRAISYAARHTEESDMLVAPSIEVAAPDARRNVIDNWIIPQPEAARLTRRAFVEAGLADLNGPDIAGYGKLLVHGWLSKQFTPEALSANPLSPAMAIFKAVLDAGDILMVCQLDAWNEAHARLIYEERNVRPIAEVQI